MKREIEQMAGDTVDETNIPQKKKKLEGIASSEEEGFTGDPSSWFNDEEFKKQFVGSMDYKEVKDSYFGSYSHFGIHEEMLKDQVRTRSYLLACKNNGEQFKNKIVLDIGCGTGILSIFAAKAGAKHVYAVDNAEITDFAREIVRKNGFENTITVIKGKMEEIELPVKEVDIIISEWMGYFLLFESMLDTIIYARDKYLVKDGLLLPDKVRLNIAGIEDSQYKQEKFGFWTNVYGVNMDCISKIALSEPLVDIVYPSSIITSSSPFLELDLYTVRVEDLIFANKFTFSMTRTENLYALVAWFDVFFSRLKFPIKFTTSPYSSPTHWKQTVFYLPEIIRASEEGTFEGVIAVSRSSSNPRNLDIKITYKYSDLQYILSNSQMFKLH